MFNFQKTFITKLTFFNSKSISEVVVLLTNHMNTYPDDLGMCVAVFSLYIALVKIPKHESEAGDLIPLTAGLFLVIKQE